MVLGYVFSIFMSYMILKGKVPEYLKAPILLVTVLLCFGIADEVMHETGMLAVTVMGITLARMKNIFLLSVIFVILTKIFLCY